MEPFSLDISDFDFFALPLVIVPILCCLVIAALTRYANGRITAILHAVEEVCC